MNPYLTSEARPFPAVKLRRTLAFTNQARLMPCIVSITALLLCLSRGTACAQSVLKSAAHRLPAAMEKAIADAGANRGELRTALRRVPPEQREGMEFLIENMPVADLRTLSAKFLLEDVAMAYDALAKAPWKDRISKEIFLNAILPYACLNETRDESRKALRAKAEPLIAGCTTPSEAAQCLNRKLFPLLNVRYSTGRKRPDQSPLETMQSGKATCTGLSILLVDACRAIGVPARVVGTPMWMNLRGNHTWVEIWDDGWHFTGAAEPDPQGLDRGWFTHDASLARKDLPEHAIYASSFKKTGLAFPLVWARDIGWVPAENVTDRYTPKTPPADTSESRLLIRVLDSSGKRVAAKVTVRAVGNSAVALEGISKGETADTNDLLTFELPRACPPLSYEITVTYAGQTVRREVKSGAEAQEVVVIPLNASAAAR